MYKKETITSIPLVIIVSIMFLFFSKGFAQSADDIQLEGSAQAADIHREVAAANERAKHEIKNALKSARTVGAFLKFIKSKIDGRSYAFLKSEIKGLEKTRYRIEEKANGNVILIVGHTIVTFQIERNASGISAYLNNKRVEVTPGMPIGEVWARALRVLPATKSPVKVSDTNASVWKLFFPEAHALVGTTGAGLIILALWTGYLKYLDVQQTCNLYEKFEKSCNSGQLQDARINSYAEFDIEWTKSALLCKESARNLRQCLIGTTASRPEYSPPANLRNYFGNRVIRQAQAELVQ